MPRKYERKLGSRQYMDYSSDKLNECLSAIRNGTMTTRKAEAHFGIPRRTIINKMKGYHSSKPGKPAIFSVEEEKTFVDCVFSMSEFGFPVNELELRCIVNAYLSRIGRQVKQFTNNFPGKEWLRSFLKRNPEVTVRFAANIKKSRASINEVTLREYIQNLNQVLIDVPPSNIFNYDESNLTDDPGSKRVLTKRGVKYPENIRNASKASVSLMMCGSAIGEVLPPYIVYKSKNMWSTWTEGGPVGCRYNNSKSGWFTTEIFTDWFQTIVLPKLKKLEGKKVLIGDNLSSHINDIVLKLCIENNVCFVCLPPNSTHLTQPLDVAFFRPFKCAWRKILGSYKESQAGIQNAVLQKQHFPLLLKKLMDAMAPTSVQNLVSGFRKCGIFPCDVDVLLERLPGITCEKETIEDSFKEFLSKKRDIVVGNTVPMKKKRKVNVAAGKSIAHEVYRYVDDVVPVPVPVLTDVGSSKQVSIVNQEKSKESLQKTVDEHHLNTVDLINSNKIVNVQEVLSEVKIKKKKINSKQSLDYRYQSSSEGEDAFSLHDSSSGIEDFQDLFPENKELQNIFGKTFRPLNKKIGEYVVFSYEGEVFPGIIEHFTDERVVISSMQRSTKAWKWPTKPDKMVYTWDKILGCINPPRPINKRGFFLVPELSDIWF